MTSAKAQALGCWRFGARGGRWQWWVMMNRWSPGGPSWEAGGRHRWKQRDLGEHSLARATARRESRALGAWKTARRWFSLDTDRLWSFKATGRRGGLRSWFCSTCRCRERLRPRTVPAATCGGQLARWQRHWVLGSKALGESRPSCLLPPAGVSPRSVIGAGRSCPLPVSSPHVCLFLFLLTYLQLSASLRCH